MIGKEIAKNFTYPRTFYELSTNYYSIYILTLIFAVQGNSALCN